MKKIFIVLFLAFVSVIAFADDQKEVQDVAVEFVRLSYACDSSVATLMDRKFKDEGQEWNKAAYLKHLRSLKVMHTRGVAAWTEDDDLKCLRKYYGEKNFIEKKVRKFSADKIKKEAKKIRTTYKTYEDDLKKAVASVKAVKVSRSGANYQVTVSLVPYSQGKPEEIKENYELTLCYNKVKKVWLVCSLEEELD